MEDQPLQSQAEFENLSTQDKLEIVRKITQKYSMDK